MRLVKGAYWDSEIKWAQERGLADYPVFTRKRNTDVSYLACMRLMLTYPQQFAGQFATAQRPHDCRCDGRRPATRRSSSSACTAWARGSTRVLSKARAGLGDARPCRIYAPVGDHEDLLGYLVRRLLENGANTSFVNRLANDEMPIAHIIRDPVEEAERERSAGTEPAKSLVKPRDVFWPERRNSSGLALDNAAVRATILAEMNTALGASYEAAPIVSGSVQTGTGLASLVLCPHDRSQRMGTVRNAAESQIDAGSDGGNSGRSRLGPPRRTGAR